MIGTVRKHQKWLWAVIVVLTIISFLYWTPSINKGGGDSGGGEANFGSINGKKISRNEFATAQNEIRIYAFLTSGKWVENSDLSNPDFMREVYNRVVLFEKMKELKIEPSEVAAIQWIKNLLTRGAAPGQDLDYAQFEKIVKTTLEPHGITQQDFQDFARHELGREHLQAVYGMTGTLVTPAEATDLYRYENEPLNAEVVVFSPSNYVASVTNATADAIEKFYQQRQPDYALPERAQVNYVKFAATDFLTEADQQLAKLTNLTQQIEMQYDKSTNSGNAEFKGMTRDAALKKIKDDARHEVALSAARKKAAEFIESLFKGHSESNPLQPGDLTKTATASNVSVKESPLFDRSSSTNEAGLPETAISAAFRLNPGDPEDKVHEQLFTVAPIMGHDGAYVLGYNKIVPRENQPLEKVRAKVTEDFKRAEALKIARDNGVKFGAAVTNGVAKGKTFDAIAGEFKLKPKTLLPFSLNSRSVIGLDEQIDIRQLKQVALRLAPGKASDFIATMDGGFVLNLKSRSPIDPAKLQAELPKFMEQIRDQRQYQAYGEWFQKQWQEMHVVAPLLEQKQKPKT